MSFAESGSPKDYGKHQMYLFKGDYIRMNDKTGKLKFEGYYLSSFNVNENRVYVISDNSSKIFSNGKLRGKSATLGVQDKCIKLNVDILGEVTGYNNGEGISCGEPLSLLKENE